MSGRDHSGTNRNGIIGDFDRYRPIKRSLDEIIEASRMGKSPAATREATFISDLNGARLIRYRLGSSSLRDDCEALNGKGPGLATLTSTEFPDRLCVFGIVDDSDRVRAILSVTINSVQSEQNLSHVITDTTDARIGEWLHSALLLLDVPAGWRLGADNHLRSAFDLWYDEAELTWIRKEPRYAVAVTFERVCFQTNPTLSEKIDVVIPLDPDHPIEGEDKDKIYWSISHYRDLAFGRFEALSSSLRPGFSSWLAGETRMVKLLGSSLDSEIAAEETPPSPGI